MDHMILLAEDEPIQRRQLARVLNNEGYVVLQASTGREAIRILNEQSVDIVLTDLKMPELDGVSLLNYIKANFSQVLVAIITAHPDALRDAKPDAVLGKPFGGEQLKEMVRSLFEKQAA